MDFVEGKGKGALLQRVAKVVEPLLRGSKFGQPEVVRICKELILQAKSTTREAGKAGLHE